MGENNTGAGLVAQDQGGLFTGCRPVPTSNLISNGLPCDIRREQKVKPTASRLKEFSGLRGTFSTILIDPPWRWLLFSECDRTFVIWSSRLDEDPCSGQISS